MFKAITNAIFLHKSSGKPQFVACKAEGTELTVKLPVASFPVDASSGLHMLPAQGQVIEFEPLSAPYDTASYRTYACADAHIVQYRHDSPADEAPAVAEPVTDAPFTPAS